MILLRDINKTYFVGGENHQALLGVNLTIPAKSIFGIIGRSGAGKSTLLRCINLLERPDSGEVLIEGKNILAFSPGKVRELCREIGMIFQHFNLLDSKNIFDNVALPLRLQKMKESAVKERVNDLLDLVELSDKAHQYPFNLSGGQKQRVAIARALSTNPRVLLSDEATSALDPEMTESILNLLKKINKELGVTIVLITHEMDVLKKICTDGAVLDGGCVIEEGSIIELFTSPKKEMTKRLINAALHIELPTGITLESSWFEGGYPVVRLAFVDEKSKQPLMAGLMKDYHVACNVLLADIENIGDLTIGVTVCQLLGDRLQIEKAMNYLQATVKVEVLGYAG